MYFSQIISLLSNHRDNDRPEIPITLSKTQIISLVGSSLSPNESKDNLNPEINEALKELEAQGEINSGSGNRYCIAPPTVLAQAENNFTGLVFKGDRAYLSLAHKVLTTEQKHTEIKLRSRINNFQVIKNKLSQVGITFLTVEQSIESLPLPELPSKAITRSPYSQDPFENLVLQYIPQNKFDTQPQRWREIVKSHFLNKSLLQLATQEYLWFEDRRFYELQQDKAVLTMFALDKEKEHSLQIPWDKPEGKLHLKGVSLPGTYARWLWSLSEPVENCYRTRYVKPENQSLIESAFKRLGCLLV
jgi:hypothetical protein